MQQSDQTITTQKGRNGATGFVVFALLVCGAGLLGFMSHIMGRINSLSNQVEQQKQDLKGADIQLTFLKQSVSRYIDPTQESGRRELLQPDTRDASFAARLKTVEDRLSALGGRFGTVPNIERAVEQLNGSMLDVELNIRKLSRKVNNLEIDAEFGQ